MTKGAQKLTKKLIDYLDKEKTVLNEMIINASKLKTQINKAPDNHALTKQYIQLKSDLRLAQESWQERSGSGFRVSGYLRQELLGMDFEKMSKNEQLSVVSKLWNKTLKSNNPKKTHVGLRRFILSPDPKSLEGLTNIQKKEIIERTVDDTMKKFKDRYIVQGDRISYLSSVHLDTDSTHAHIYLLPYTKQGQYVSMNADRYMNRYQKKYINKDRLEDRQDKQENKLDKLMIMAANSFRKERSKFKVPELQKRKEYLQNKIKDSKDYIKKRTSKLAKKRNLLLGILRIKKEIPKTREEEELFRPLEIISNDRSQSLFIDKSRGV